MSSQILFIRHGITEGNKNKWFYGGLDLPLLEEGKEELRQQKEQGLYPQVPEEAQFFTTGLIRTNETLETLFGPQKYEVIEDLREMEFGELEGRTFDEIKDEPSFKNWSYDESGDVQFPGGESRNEFATRVRRGYQELVSRHRLKELEFRHRDEEPMTVMICHGGVIAGLMQDIFPGEQEDMWAWMPVPGCGYLVEFEDGKPVSHCQIGERILY